MIEENDGKIILDQTREELADFLATTRPSFPENYQIWQMKI
ncbi:MAG: hypothetical protein ACLTA5_03715 [Anaerococcus obesiensis]